MTQNNQGTVDAILMASGYSRRFGAENKLLADFRGKPLAMHILQLACQIPQFSNVYFVCADEEVAKLARGLSVVKIHNRQPHLGMRESVRLGVQPSSADHYAFFPCDMPLLDEATVLAVIEQRAAGKIAFPECRGHPGNPSVFSSFFRQELIGLAEGQQAKDIKQRHPGRLVPVPIDDPLVLADIDTASDLLQLEL